MVIGNWHDLILCKRVKNLYCALRCRCGHWNPLRVRWEPTGRLGGSRYWEGAAGDIGGEEQGEVGG